MHSFDCLIVMDVMYADPPGGVVGKSDPSRTNGEAADGVLSPRDWLDVSLYVTIKRASSTPVLPLAQ